MLSPLNIQFGFEALHRSLVDPDQSTAGISIVNEVHVLLETDGGTRKRRGDLKKFLRVNRTILN